jgi:hypothetical protein
MHREETGEKGLKIMVEDIDHYYRFSLVNIRARYLGPLMKLTDD